MGLKLLAFFAAGLPVCVPVAAWVQHAQVKPDGEPMSYEFQQDLAPYVGLSRDGKVLLGHLDAAGNFVPLPGVKPIRPEDPFSGPRYSVLNKPLKPDEPVYEYRSGSLIQGTLDKEGNFRPEVGSKVIAFQDYLKGYNPRTSSRVYNLPGRLVAKAKKETDKE